MNITFQSTFRGLAAILSLGCGCAVMPGCSINKENDWFNWNKNEPSTQSQPEDQAPHTTDQSTQASPSTPPSTPPSAPAPSEPEPEPKPEPAEPAPEPNPTQPDPAQIESPDVEEIVHLYRRLHVEMDQETRSQLIVELLNDERERVRLLGFELASRDLSSGATLSADAANAAKILLSDPLPSIRLGSSRLITRLALPDAMTLLTEALADEQDFAVAESLLLGIERWPNSEARDDVLRWYQVPGTVHAAAANAAWSIADLNLWNPDTHQPILRSVYRSLDDQDLTLSDMRLIAATGSSSDIDRIMNLAQDLDFSGRSNAAIALVNTPRGVDTLIVLSNADPQFTPAAAEAIQAHRLNPNGIRRLASLHWLDEQTRIDTLVRVCAKLDHEQLADAIRLTRTDGSINDELSILLLNQLIVRPQDISPRSAPGVILLAELELNNQRPDRTLEILSLLQDSGTDPESELRIHLAKATSHILLKEFGLAELQEAGADPWFKAISMESDQESKIAIAREVLARAIEITESQRSQLDAIIASAQTPAQEAPALTPNDQPDQP